MEFSLDSSLHVPSCLWKFPLRPSSQMVLIRERSFLTQYSVVLFRCSKYHPREDDFRILNRLPFISLKVPSPNVVSCHRDSSVMTSRIQIPFIIAESRQHLLVITTSLRFTRFSPWSANGLRYRQQVTNQPCCFSETMLLSVVGPCASRMERRQSARGVSALALQLGFRQ